MKKMLLCIALISILSLGGFMPFRGTDVAKLHPVEVLAVSCKDSAIIIGTDTGLCGVGKSVDQTIENLKRSAPGKVFMETANYILIGAGCEQFLPDFYAYLRPACQVYILEGEGKLKTVAEYLESHPSKITILRYRQGNINVPKLVARDEVYEIVEP